MTEHSGKYSDRQAALDGHVAGWGNRPRDLVPCPMSLFWLKGPAGPLQGPCPEPVLDKSVNVGPRARLARFPCPMSLLWEAWRPNDRLEAVIKYFMLIYALFRLSGRISGFQA